MSTEKKAQHTPGPWELRHDEETGDPFVAYGICMIVENVWGTIAAFNSHELSKNREEREANAHLIAAAPDMMAALKALVLWDSGDEDFMAAAAEYCTVNGISTVGYEEMLYKNASLALQKAEAAQ